MTQAAPLQIFRRILSTDRKSILLIVGLALVVRLAFVLALQDRFYFKDTIHYEDCALNILAGQGYGDYTRAPLYPAWIALVFILTGGKNILLWRIIESVLGALLCLILFAIGKRLFNAKTGLLAAAIVAVYPMLVFVSGLLYPTLLCTVLVALGTYFAVLVRDRRSVGLSLMVGLCFGLAALAVAPTALLVVAIAVCLALFSQLTIRGRAVNVVVILASFVMTLAPWTVRNYARYHKFVPIRQAAEKHFLPNLNVKGHHRDLQATPTTKLSASFQHPLSFGRYFAKRFLLFWRLAPSRKMASADAGYNARLHTKDSRVARRNTFSVSDLTYYLNAAAFAPVLLLVLVAVLTSRKQLDKLLILLLPILTLAATYSLFFVKVRFRIPAEPLMIIIAAFAATRILDFLKGAARDGYDDES